MNFDAIIDGVANETNEITKDYSREERAAFLQGMMIMLQTFEFSVDMVAEETGDEVPTEVTMGFSDIKKGIIEAAKAI